MVLVPVADQYEFEIFGFDADGRHHVSQISPLAKTPGIDQKRLISQYRIVPGRSQVPVTAVEIFGRQPDNFQSGRQIEPHRHAIAAVVTLVDNFFYILFQFQSVPVYNFGSQIERLS